MIRISILLWVAITTIGLFRYSAKAENAPKNRTILIVRHGEKPTDGPHLSQIGLDRSRQYVRYFKTLKLDSKWVTIDHLFATKETSNSNRPQETLKPLSTALGHKIHAKFKDDEVEDLAKVLEDKSYAGQTLLVCWHHGEIPDLLKALGVRQKDVLPSGKWPDDVFGSLIVLHYDEKGNVSVHVLNEGLEPNDAKHHLPIK